MIKGAQLQDEYYGGQAVEVRNTHNGRDTWRPARIHRRTSRGCEVVYRDGRDQRPQHIMLSDLRPMEKTGRVPTKITTPALTAAEVDAINKRLDEEARARDAAKPTQQLVLVRKQQPVLQEAQPPVRVMRRMRQVKAHHATPLSQYLRDARLAAGLQQRVLSERSGVSQPRLSHIELGDIDSTDDELLGLAGALNLDLDHLLKLRDEDADAIETHAEEAPKVHALPTPPPAPPPLPVPSPPPASVTFLDDVRTPPKPISAPQQPERRERDRNRESDDMARLLQEVAMLRGENLVLREAVVFYAGMDRS